MISPFTMVRTCGFGVSGFIRTCVGGRSTGNEASEAGLYAFGLQGAGFRALGFIWV